MKWNSILVFILGFFSCAFLVFLVGGSDLEIPFGTGFVVSDYSKSAPADHVIEEDILVFEDRVILKVANVTLSNYADSGSMRPFFDKGANGIRVVPANESEVDVGDIVSYRFGGMLIVHRVIEKGFDDEGFYYVVKGDNNLIRDGKIRFIDIEYITIGIIY
jgi:hypothetical protein